MAKPAKPASRPPKSQAAFAAQPLAGQIADAMARHVAQCAWVVYSADFTSLECDERRVQDARGVLETWQAVQEGGDDAASKALKAVLDGTSQGPKVVPQGPPAPAALSPAPKSLRRPR
jgi:hypothetical protein